MISERLPYKKKDTHVIPRYPGERNNRLTETELNSAEFFENYFYFISPVPSRNGGRRGALLIDSRREFSTPNFEFK